MTGFRVVLIASIFAACSNSGTNTSPDGGVALLPGFNPPAPPVNGMQIILPIQHDLQPGTSNEICTYTGIQATEDINVRTVEAAQAQSGHHVAVWYTKVPMPAGTSHPCSDADMVNFRFVAGASNNAPTTIPGQLVLVIPKGTWITVQEHYINATDGVIDSQSVVNLDFADPGQQYTKSSAMAFTNAVLDLPPGPDTLDLHCTMQQDVKAWFAMPHMHKYGNAFQASLTHAGTTTKIVDMNSWDADFEFSGPQTLWDPTTPQVFAAGDSVDVHCGWTNTTSADLHFGQEMCVFFVQTVDEQGLGNVACDAGQWVPF